MKVVVLKLNLLIRFMELDEIMYVSMIYLFDYMLFFIVGGVWNKFGGIYNVGEDIVIGVVDIGIYFDYLSFVVDDGVKLYGLFLIFLVKCGIDLCVFGGFCNGKIVGV